MELLLLSEEEFREKFKNSPVKRAKRRGLLRNAATALAASNEVDAIFVLEHALNDAEELVRHNRLGIGADMDENYAGGSKWQQVKL